MKESLIFKITNVSYNDYLSKIKGLNLYQYVEEILNVQNKELYEIRFREVDLAVRKFYEEKNFYLDFNKFKSLFIIIRKNLFW